MDIKEALEQLNHEDDDSWTEDGLPKVEVVRKITGSDVTRREITDAAPGFRRGQGITEEAPPQPSGPEARYAQLQTEAAEIDRKVMEKQREIGRLKDELEVLYLAARTIERNMAVVERLLPNKQNSDIREYLNQVAQSREARAANARSFLGAGVKLGEILPHLQHKSKLDQALNARKAAPGSTRPGIPIRR